MNARQITRLSNALSRMAKSHAHAVSLHVILGAHRTLTAAAKGFKSSPATAVELTTLVRPVEEVLLRIEG